MAKVSAATAAKPAQTESSFTIIRKSTLPVPQFGGRGAAPAPPRVSINNNGQIVMNTKATEAIGGHGVVKHLLFLFNSNTRKLQIRGYAEVPKLTGPLEGLTADDFFNAGSSKKSNTVYVGVGTLLKEVGYDYSAGKRVFEPLKAEDGVITISLAEDKLPAIVTPVARPRKAKTGVAASAPTAPVVTSTDDDEDIDIDEE